MKLTNAGGKTTITGPANGVTIGGGDQVGAFEVSSFGVTAAFSGLTLADCVVGINVLDGTVSVDDCTFASNAAKEGGAIFNEGILTVADSTFTGNSATTGGGAIENTNEMTVTNCTFVGNSTAGSGGAIYARAGETTVSYCTLVGNSAGNGGAIRNLIVLNLSHSIVAGNSATVAGNEISSIARQQTSVHEANNLLGNGAETNAQAFNAFTPIAADLVGTSDALNLALNDIVSTTLADNGGPTHTLAIPAGSPAINAAVADPAVTTDQRGTPRPQGLAPDLGAFELLIPPSHFTGLSFEYQGRLAIVFNYDADARLSFAFPTSFQLQSGGSTFSVSSDHFHWSADGKQLALDLTGLLPDGNYSFADFDYGLSTMSFFVLTGDADHDRSVGPGDFNLLATGFGNPGATYATGDFNYDGKVDEKDFNLLAANFGKTLPLPRAPQAASAGTASATSKDSTTTFRPVTTPVVATSTRAKARKPAAPMSSGSSLKAGIVVNAKGR